MKMMVLLFLIFLWTISNILHFKNYFAQKGVGGNVYMKGITVDVLLKECVEKIDWGIDWEKLKIDWKKIIGWEIEEPSLS